MIRFNTHNSQNQNICVVAVGDGGIQALNYMMRHHDLGVSSVAINTSGITLDESEAHIKLSLGKERERIHGDATVGRYYASEQRQEISRVLQGYHIVLVVATLGGGVGTGAAPVVAQLARDLGAAVVGIVTLPFHFEGARKRAIAERGLVELQQSADTIIPIHSNRLLRYENQEISLKNSFDQVNEIASQAAQCISNILSKTGAINIDLADVQTVLRVGGSAAICVGKGSGEKRTVEAAEQIIEKLPLGMRIDGARGVIFNVKAPLNFGTQELQEAAELVQAHCLDPQFFMGLVYNDQRTDDVEITLIATGLPLNVPEDGMAAKVAQILEKVRPNKAPVEAGQYNQAVIFSPSPSTPARKSTRVQSNFKRKEWQLPAYLQS